jgi:hypothetical protein
VQFIDVARRSAEHHNIRKGRCLRFHRRNGMGVAFSTGQRRKQTRTEWFMDLAIWIPSTVILGLVTMGLMFAFVIGCDKV